MKKQHIIFSTLIAVMVVFAAVIPAVADPEEPAAPAATTNSEVTSELSITVPAYFDIQERAGAVKTLSGSDKVSVDADAVTLKNAINVVFDVTTNATATVRVSIADENNNQAANGTNVAFALDGETTTAGVAVASAMSNALGNSPIAASNPGVIAFPHTLTYSKNGGQATAATFESGHWDIVFDPGVGDIVFNIASGTSVNGTYSTQDPAGIYKTYLTATKVETQQASNDPDPDPSQDP